MRLVKKRANKLTDTQTGALLSLIKSAEERDKPFFDQCEQALRWLQGDDFPSMTGGRGKNTLARTEGFIRVNLAHAHVRSLVPSLFFREPTVRAWAINPTQERSAVAWEQLINAFLRRSDYKPVTKEVVLDAAVYPEGWKKWVFFKGADEEITTGTSPILDSDESAGSASELGQGGSSFWDSKMGLRGVRISPRDVITDSPDRKPDNSRFIAVKYRKPLSEMLLDSRYKDGRQELRRISDARKRNSDTSPVPSFNLVQNSPENERDTILSTQEEMIDFYEVWVYQLVDFNLYKQVVVLADGCKTPLRQPTGWEEYSGIHLNTYPFNNLVLLPIPDSRGHSELAVWYSLQKTMNWVVSKIITQVDNKKQFYNYYSKNAVNPNKAVNQFHSSKTREFIEAKEAGQPVVEQVPVHANTSEDHQLVTMLLGLIQHVTGLTTNRRGATGARTATEADIIEGSAQIKMDEKADTVSDFIKRDCEILIRMIRSFVTESIVFRITGNTGPVKWQQFTVEDAAWSPDVDIEPESFRRSVSQQRIQAYMTMLNILPNIAPVLGPNVNFQALISRIMQELEVPNADEIVGNNVPAEVKQMQEIIQMVLGVGAEVLPNDDHIKEVATLEAFITSEVFGLIQPDAQAAIEQHYQMHMVALQEAQKQTGPISTGNSFDDTLRNGNPASEARQETSDSRMRF